MTKRTGSTNPELKELIYEVKELASIKKVNLWKRVAYELEKPTRKRRTVDIFRINKYTKEKEIALVPGKVLSDGDLTKKITVAAFQFSDKAKDKISKIGRAISIKELIKMNPEGKGVRIIG